MTDQKGFPQIPTTVWWGMRNLLKSRPSAKFDAGMIGASLGVQPTAANQYMTELRRVGILDDEGKATDVAMKWRQDDGYVEAVSELANEAYPESLLTIAPPGEAERQTVVNWFMGQGLGEGSAKNKAATYLLVTSQEPSDGSPIKAQQPTPKEKTPKPKKSTVSSTGNNDDGRKPARPAADSFPLNVNVQIHISADASGEQIDSIFASMRKYLRDD